MAKKKIKKSSDKTKPFLDKPKQKLRPKKSKTSHNETFNPEVSYTSVPTKSKPMLCPEGVDQTLTKKPKPTTPYQEILVQPKPKVAPTVDSVRKKAILDLFVTPLTVGSTTIGATLLLLSWALGTGPLLAFTGLLGILIGLGVTGTNFAFNLEKVIKNAAHSVEKETIEAANLRLDELDEKLCRDRDPRDQMYLRDMRELYNAFIADHEAGKLADFCSPQTVDHIKELFDVVVNKLEVSFDIWEQSKILRGKAKDLAQVDREKIIEDVGKAVEHMGEVINGIRSLKIQSQKGDLERLRENLDRQLNAARRAHERIDSINQELRENR